MDLRKKLFIIAGVYVIESPFAAVRLRRRRSEGAGPRQKGLLKAVELLAMTEQH